MAKALAFVLALTSLVVGCQRRANLESSRAADTAGAALPDSAPVVPASSAGPRATARAGSDSATLATPRELAELSTELIVPVQGVPRSDLRDTYTARRVGHPHEALDILAARGTPVLSAAAGRLLRTFQSRAGGLMVYATDASERFILLYGHLDRYPAGLKEGMPLARGQVIGYVGTTGNAPPGTPHLHFGILRGHPRAGFWWTGVAVNPYPLLVGAHLPGPGRAQVHAKELRGKDAKDTGSSARLR